MLDAPFEAIFSKNKLKNALERINPHTKGIDGISLADFKKDTKKNVDTLWSSLIGGTYVPEPIKNFTIPKNGTTEKRPIALSSVKDKIVQAILAHTLSDYFDSLFSDKSYAYRPGKSYVKAVSRCSDFLNRKYNWIVKSDIDNFFETINHDKLLNLLDSHIKDKRTIRLISLLLQNGIFQGTRYKAHDLGIHQGDALSPVLSNIYLNVFDTFLEEQHIAFVRYADDFVIFAHAQEEAQKIHHEMSQFLHTWDLRLGNDKTFIKSVADGFTYLGVSFKNKERTIEKERFNGTKEKMLSYGDKKLSFNEFIARLSQYVKLLKNNYEKILSGNADQLKEMQTVLMQTLTQAVFNARQSEQITTKTAFKEACTTLEMFGDFSKEERTVKIDLAINTAYEKYMATKSIKKETPLLEKKKEEYSKNFTQAAHIHITKEGVILGISKNKFTLKEQGKVLKTFPAMHIKHIIVAAKGVSFSSNVIEFCAKNDIPVDFVDYAHFPVASMVGFRASIAHNTLKQLEILYSPSGLFLAKEFFEGKAKNQINYIKYLNKYHKKYDDTILKMEKIFKNGKQSAMNAAELMGYEGSLSALYWGALGQTVSEEYGFSARITKGAKDTINSALNYGYAILYGKVRYALVKAGLSLHVSYLHALNEREPTLVFDAIEEFRPFIVDRTIISMANKNEPITLTKEGLLTAESRKLIAQNIFERLGSYTTWKKESHKVGDIIFHQAYLLARHIRNEDKYNAFIGKF